MHTFRYTAAGRNGEPVSGTMQAESEHEAMLRLKETYAVVLKIAKVLPVLEQKPITGKVNEKTLAVMCSQFAIILSSGLPIVRAVELIAAQTQDKTLKRVLKAAAGDVAAGYSLAQSLQNRSHSLPTTFIETVRSGEESGTLDIAFRRLEGYYDKSSKIKGKVKAAMIYPTFTMVVAAIVVVIIMVVAVPAFTKSFASMGVELPGITLALIAMSSFFTRFWPLLGGGALALFFAYKIYAQTEKGKLTDAAIKLKIPVLGNIAQMKAAAQFANTMSTLLAAGLPMLNATAVTASILDNAVISAAVTAQLPGLEGGRMLGQCLNAADIFPPLLREMVSVGEETGTLEGTLRVVGTYYDNETDQASQKALSLLEPVIIVFLAGIVAFVLLSVYLPMFSLYGNMG